MILSGSRRTDIPSYYSEWFMNRLQEGTVSVRNPMNHHQVSEIDISPSQIDCIVFWTKNPSPMMKRLSELAEYKYCFQFTLTGYGRDVEPNLPHKREVMIPCFQELSNRIGRERIVWRYDPILFTKRYTEEYHIKAFEEIARSLSGYTEKVVISFFDWYRKIQRQMEQLKVLDIEQVDVPAFVSRLVEIAKKNQMVIESCGEKMELSEYGVCHGSCISQEWIEKTIGSSIRVKKERNQRKECGCVQSVDVGAYDTCMNGCLYCYANASMRKVKESRLLYDLNSPILCGEIINKDRVTKRRV